MPKKPYLTPEERYANKRAAMENYRHRVRRFTLQFSLQDTEALEWFERQPDKGKYLKGLMLVDKARQLGEPEMVGKLYDLNGLEVDEMAVDYNALLYDKLEKEYNDFLEELKGMPVEQAIEKAYEKVMKYEFLCYFESHDLEQKEAKALYGQKYPLDYCYQEWRDNDFSMMDEIHDTVTDVLKDAVKEMKDKQRESR